MCTVTFMPCQSGYCLAMNRDETLARPQGLPPNLKVIQNRRILSPSEPTGGTWIALNDSGVSLALINWYSVRTRVNHSPVTRGLVVNWTIPADHPNSVETRLDELPLKQINPFRLVGVFQTTGEIAEWRWDLKALERINHPWETQQWISSGFDEPTAQRERSRTFQRALEQESAGTLQWLRRLHRSHAPARGPFSTCMHRADAATISYSEVVISARIATMRHCNGPLCQTRRPQTEINLKPV